MSFGAPNHTQTPNSLFDLLPDMDETELRVTLVIIRETFGWHRPSVELTLAELQARTGLSKQGVWNGLEKGQTRGTIVKTADGRRRTFALNVSAAEGSQPSGPSSVNSVDQRSRANGPLSRPGKVNPVDRDGQLSGPSSVNSVDQTNPAQAAPSGQKRGAERKTKEIQRKKTETGTDALPALEPSVSAVSAEPQDQDSEDQGLASSTGAADAARGNTPDTPLQVTDSPTASGRAPNATSPKDGPGAAPVIHSPVDNFPETSVKPLLVGVFGAAWLGRLVGEDPTRADWFGLPSEVFGAQKDDALTSSPRGKWKGALITLLDAEAARRRRARRPVSTAVLTPAQSVQATNDEIDRLLRGDV